MSNSKTSPLVTEVKSYLETHKARGKISEPTYKELFEAIYQDYLNGGKSVEFLSALAEQILYLEMIYKGRKFEDLRFEDLLEVASELSYKLSKEAEKRDVHNYYLQAAHEAMVQKKSSSWKVGLKPFVNNK
ncbi:hypothetical protein BH10PAT2_BH10PAT2_2960 [soil metagenome]